MLQYLLIQIGFMFCHMAIRSVERCLDETCVLQKFCPKCGEASIQNDKLFILYWILRM